MTWEPDYLTVAQLKAELNIPANDTTDDTQVARWVTAASRAIDSWAHRQFGNVASEARTYTPVWDRHRCKWVAEIDDLPNPTGVVVVQSGVTLAGTTYSFEPVNSVQKGRPFERILLNAGADVTITPPLWGWSAIPVPVVEAAVLQGTRLAARRNSPFGIAGSPSDGSEMRLLARIDPDVEVVLGKKLRREWWAA